MAIMGTNPPDPNTLQERYEESDFAALGVGPAAFNKAMKAAQDAADKDEGGPAGAGTHNTHALALWASLVETLDNKAEKAQAKADAFESRSMEVKDPARAEILAKRAEIQEDKAEHFARSADLVGELDDIHAGGLTAMNEFYSTIPDKFLEGAAHYEERAADLLELSSLVRENGNPEWANRILTRADRATAYGEKLTQSAQEFSELPVPGSGPVTPGEAPWLSNDSVQAIQTQLNSTVEFESSVVNSVREISDGELDAIREVAIELGADEADMEFFDFLANDVGIRVVFVDDLVSENGAFGAFGGEATIPQNEGLGILMDSTFVDVDFDNGASGINEVSAQGGEVFLHEATHILQSFGLVDFSGEVGDGNPAPELAAGETINELDGEDQAVVVETLAGDYLEDTEILGDDAPPGGVLA